MGARRDEGGGVEQLDQERRRSARRGGDRPGEEEVGR
jgi:hypothetical protein